MVLQVMSENKNKLYLTFVAILALIVGFIFYITGQAPVQINSSEESEFNTPVTSELDLGINMSGYVGELLAGSYNKVVYLEFNQQDFEKAKNDGKIIYLEFYANWCANCATQQNDIYAGLSQLERKDLVAFRVNYNDSGTDDFEKALATQFSVAYQYHKVVLKGDEVLYNKNEIWDAQKLVNTLNQFK